MIFALLASYVCLVYTAMQEPEIQGPYFGMVAWKINFHLAFQRSDWPDSKAGVGNRQSIAGRIDCMILSSGHIQSEFENFVLKIHNIMSQIY